MAERTMFPPHEVEDELDEEIGVAMRTVAMLRGDIPRTVQEVPAPMSMQDTHTMPDTMPPPETKMLGRLGWACVVLAVVLAAAFLFN